MRNSRGKQQQIPAQKQQKGYKIKQNAKMGWVEAEEFKVGGHSLLR